MDDNMGERRNSPFSRECGNESSRMKQLYQYTENLLEENKIRNKAIQDHIRDMKAFPSIPSLLINLSEQDSSSSQISPRQPNNISNQKKASNSPKKDITPSKKLNGQERKSLNLPQEAKGISGTTKSLLKRIQNTPTSSQKALRLIKQQNNLREHIKTKDNEKRGINNLEDTPKFQKENPHLQFNNFLAALNNKIEVEKHQQFEQFDFQARLEGLESCFSFGNEEIKTIQSIGDFNQLNSNLKQHEFTDDNEKKALKKVTFSENVDKQHSNNEENSLKPQGTSKVLLHSIRAALEYKKSLNEHQNANQQITPVKEKEGLINPIQFEARNQKNNQNSFIQNQNSLDYQKIKQHQTQENDNQPQRTLQEMRKKLVKGASGNHFGFDGKVADFIQCSNIKRTSSQEYLLQEWECKQQLSNIKEVIENQQMREMKRSVDEKKISVTNQLLNEKANQITLKVKNQISEIQVLPTHLTNQELWSQKQGPFSSIQGSHTFSLMESPSTCSNVSSSATVNSAHGSIGGSSGLFDIHFQSKSVSNFESMEKPSTLLLKNQINCTKIDLLPEIENKKNQQLKHCSQSTSNQFDLNQRNSISNEIKAPLISTTTEQQQFQIRSCPKPSPMPVLANQFISSGSSKGSGLTSPSSSSSQSQIQLSIASTSLLNKKIQQDRTDSSSILKSELQKKVETKQNSSLERLFKSMNQPIPRLNEQQKKLEQLTKGQQQFYYIQSSMNCLSKQEATIDTCLKGIQTPNNKSSSQVSRTIEASPQRINSRTSIKNITPIKQISPSSAYNLKPSFTTNLQSSRNKGHFRSSVSTQQTETSMKAESHQTYYQLPNSFSHQAHSFQHSFNTERM